MVTIMNQLYQVVFTGELRHHADPEQAARDFAAVFKVPADKAWKLVLGGGEHVLKRDVDAANAERYRQVLEEIGLQVRIEPVGTPVGRPVERPAEPTATAGMDAPASAAADSNPYPPPQAELLGRVTDAGLSISGPHRRPAGHGWDWITQGFALFRQSGWAWVGAVLLFMLINIFLGLVPFIGELFNVLIGPVLLGGFMYGARMQQRGRRFEVADMFQGFRDRFGPLVTLGALYLGFVIAIMVTVGVVIGIGVAISGGPDLATLDQQDPAVLFAAIGPLLIIAVPLLLLLLIPLAMAYWFAPALVMLDGMPPLAAMQLSLQACLRNILPFLVYGLASLLLILLAMIPFGLGLLVLVPILIAATYAAYRDIFFDSP